MTMSDAEREEYRALREMIAHGEACAMCETEGRQIAVAYGDGAMTVFCTVCWGEVYVPLDRRI
jgi:hypothetical protein